MMYMTHLMTILLGPMAISSFQTTRFKMGKLLCEKYCSDITGCNVFSYHPANLFCFLGNRKTEDGFLQFHIDKKTANLCESEIRSKIQERCLVAKSGKHICVRIYPSGGKEKGIDKGHLLIMPTMPRHARVINLKNMELRKHRIAKTLTVRIDDLDYMPWVDSLLLVTTRSIPLAVHLCQERNYMSRFVELKGIKRCAVDRQNIFVFLLTASHELLKVKLQKTLKYIVHFKSPTFSLTVDPIFKKVFVSLRESGIIAVTYNGRKTVISRMRSVNALCIDESGNVLYAAQLNQIFIINIHGNSTAAGPRLDNRMSIIQADSRIFMLTKRSIYIYENNKLKKILKMPYNDKQFVPACVLP